MTPEGQEGPQQGAGQQLIPPEQAQADIQSLVSGQPVQPQGIPSPEYIVAFGEFVNSPDFDQLPPEAQQAINDYIQQLKQAVSATMEQGDQDATQQV